MVVEKGKKEKQMTRPLTHDELSSLSFFLRDNQPALKLALDIIYVSHLWDDLIDGDVDRSADDINNAFIKAFRSIPNNIFYQSLPEIAKQQLNGLIISAAMQYKDSTQLELGDEDDRFMAFVIRNAILGIIHYLMLLVGGEEWIDEQGVLFWRTFGLKGQYLEYVEEGV